MKKTIVYSAIVMVLAAVLLSGCASSASPVFLTSTPSPTIISPTSTSMFQGTTPTALPGYTNSPDWLPAGEIAFSVVKVPYTVSASGVPMSVGKSTLYLVHTDGTGLVQLVDGPGPWNEASAWSPDGTHIIYATGALGDASYNLWVMNADGSNPVQLTQYPPSGYYPAWSPDGAKIVFNALSDNNNKIALMNVDGSNQKLLTNAKYDVMPSWAPNGTIFYLRTGTISEPTGDVFTMNPDGSGTVQLTKMGYVGSYSLSPDGTKMAIYNFKDRRIEVDPVEAGGPSMTLVDSDLGCSYVIMSWSPDGQALAIACIRAGTNKGSPLYIFKADGSSYTTVPNIDSAYDPAWRP
jgi:TolB protein